MASLNRRQFMKHSVGAAASLAALTPGRVRGANERIVIGVMGQNASKPAQGAMLAIQEAQLSMEALPEFKGNVKAVRTDVLVDKAAEELYPKWRENFEQWERTGSDFGYPPSPVEGVTVCPGFL